MFVFFGKGKCPLCGNIGMKNKDVWVCERCFIVFDEFGLVEFNEFPEYTDLWNA